jgi:hypothetical protein
LGRIARTGVTAFDAAIMAVAAYVQTGGGFALTPEHLILWGSAVAAAICAVVVFFEGSSLIAWAAIGYIGFGALLTGVPEWPLIALAAALMPLVPRPRGSFVYGLGVAIAIAFATRLAVGALLSGSNL